MFIRKYHLFYQSNENTYQYHNKNLKNTSTTQNKTNKMVSLLSPLQKYV